MIVKEGIRRGVLGLPGQYARLLAGHALDQEAHELLRCPACHGPLVEDRGALFCMFPDCDKRFRIVGGVPVLLNEEESLFSAEDIVQRRNTTFDVPRSRLKQWVDEHLPSLGRNYETAKNYRLFADLLLQRSRNPVVLVIGGRIAGQGFEALSSRPEIRLVESDINFGPRTQLICDAHSLPFADYSLEGVVIQAVLQYLPDPYRCAREIERVLRPGGLVYSESAFMQQVVHGRYDFTRFTYLGMRRLFRRFSEIRSGIVGGPGIALAWSCHFFLLSFAKTRTMRSLMHALARLTLFWLKYLDAWLIKRPGAYDAASGFFFLGERGNWNLPDWELVELYRGAQ